VIPFWRRRKAGSSPCDRCLRNPRTGAIGNCPRLFQAIEQHYIDGCQHYRAPEGPGPATVTFGGGIPEPNESHRRAR